MDNTRSAALSVLLSYLQLLLTLLFSWLPSIITTGTVLSFIFIKAESKATFSHDSIEARRKANDAQINIYRWPTLMSGIAALALSDERTVAQVYYPTAFAGLVLHLCYARALFPKIAHGWTLPTFMTFVSLLLDACLCSLSAASEGTSKRIFVSLLPVSTWIVMTTTWGIIRAVHPCADTARDDNERTLEEARDDAHELQ